MSKPRLLDLFCGAGGAAAGYVRAGFDVVGVDDRPQPSYPFELIQADALDYLGLLIREQCCLWLSVPMLGDFAAIHASPPCQRYSAAAEIHDSAEDHPDLVPPTRKLLEASGLPWVMENVERAPMNTTVMLCGSMFGLGVKRHRLFESNRLLLAPDCGSHRNWYASVFGGRCVGRQRVTGARSGSGSRTQEWAKFVDELGTARESMGIDWMTLTELGEAIPPAYTFFLGKQLLRALDRRTTP